MEKILIKIFKDSFNINSKKEIDLIKRNINISELSNYDSLSFLKFISKVEKKFGFKVDQKNFKKLTSFKRIITLLKSAKRSGK
tara:strand:+ start:284 stop:532 length:249 start_codon:yes stop_codon:yes gene_type:complete